MKKKLLLSAILLTMAFSVFGCGNTDANLENADANTEADAANEDGIHVSSAEEFLDAIEPGATIIFDKGYYDLSPDIEKLITKNKKWNKQHDYVQIEECYDGYQITISDVDGLTIKGAGKTRDKVELMVEPRYADVLAFLDCSNITIENMTIGHTVEQGSCAGDVLEFSGCDDIILTNVDLYGCGTYGINSRDSVNMTVTDSVIRDCSYGLMTLVNCGEYKFTNCEMYGCDGYEQIDCYNADVTFKNCSIYDNTCDYGLLTSNKDNTIVFKSCDFGVNETEWIFNSDPEGVTFDSKCSFADVVIIDNGNSNGNANVDENIFYDYSDRNDYYKNYVVVDTVADLLDSIAPYTCVSIEPGYYNLSDYINDIDIEAFNVTHDYVQIQEVYDGYEIAIIDCDYFAIEGTAEIDSDNFKSEIVTDPRYAAVFSVNNCYNAAFYGLVMGHTENGDCSGNVLDFYDTCGILIDKCDLYGCGVYAIGGNSSSGMSVTSCYIHDCEFGPAEFWEMKDDVVFLDCDIMDSFGGFSVDSTCNLYFFNCAFGYEEGKYVKNHVNCIFDDYCEFLADYYDYDYDYDYE